ncbi:MAG: Hsp70 family protein [Lachnospiraceae bacterium]|nr:Hsp70 family protein [Lachnospiraceae bacterium]
MATKVFGIDLGTTYSCIAYVDETERPVTVNNNEGDKTTPSVVYFESETNVCVGKVAKESAELEPEKVVSFVKRSMGKDGFSFEYNDRYLTPEEVSAYILRKVAGDAAKNIGEEVANVVITHPAYFGLKEKEATRRAGEIAGLNVVSLIPEPVAAAYTYGCMSEENNGKTILVYDLGGGTFDVTMIHVTETEIEVICTGGDDNLGGYNWDQVLIEHMASVIAEQTGFSKDEIFDDPEMCQILQNKAEEAKKTLSSAEKARISLNFNGEKAKFEVTLEEFDEMTSSLCESTIVMTKQLLEVAKEKGYDHFDSLLLVGGSTYMKQIERAIVNEFGMKPQLFDPNEAVAKGAALFGNAEKNRLIEIKKQSGNGEQEFETDTEGLAQQELTDAERQLMEGITQEEVDTFVPKIGGVVREFTSVTSKSFGIVAINRNNEEKIYALIKSQTKLPVEVSEEFGTHQDNQESVLLRVFESTLDENEIDLDMGIEIGEVSMAIPAGLPAKSPIQVTFNLDKQGLLHVEGKEMTEYRTCNVDIEVRGGMSKAEIENAVAASTSISVF